MGNGNSQSNINDQIQEALDDLSMPKGIGYSVIQLPEEETDEQDIQISKESDPKCFVCEQNIPRYISLPCGCRWICISCTNQFAELNITHCPICNKEIKKIM
jgi:hypothetical protein